MNQGRTPRVLVLGTLDTKGDEFAFLRDELILRGCEPIVMDLGILGTPLFPGNISREQVLGRSGLSTEDLASGHRRGEAIQAAIFGASAIAADMFARGEIDGIIGMGGGSGTTMSRAVMSALPLGFPKVLVTTLTNVNPVISGTDVVLVRCLVDLVGLNAITRSFIRSAAGAIAGMANRVLTLEPAAKSVVITCLGVTTPGVMALRRDLLARGKEVVVLHRRTAAVDRLLEEDLVEAFVDFTPSEITEAVVYPRTGDPDDRLRNLRERAIPLITCAGGLDMLIQLVPADERSSTLSDRPFVVHSPTATLIRTTPAEQRQLGAVLGRQLRAACGPARAVIPIQGFSMWDREGAKFAQPDARRAFIEGVTAEAGPECVTLVDAHINDEAFAHSVATQLIELLDSKEKSFRE